LKEIKAKIIIRVIGLQSNSLLLTS